MSIVLNALALAAQPLHAQERPPLPGYSVAGDDGALSMWSNPANLAFDRDPSVALLYSQSLADQGATALGLANEIGPLGIGFAHRSGPNDPAWWTVSSAVSLKLAEDFTFGTHLGWQLPEGVSNNFTTFDIGLGYRPLSWLGFGGVATNLGAEFQVAEQYIGSVVLRPFGEVLMVGGEVAQDRMDTTRAATFKGTARLRPVQGLVLRGVGTSEGEYGAGLEFTLDGSALGAFTQMDTTTAGAPGELAVYLQNDDPEVDLLHLRKKVAKIDIDEAYPYQPQDTLFSRGGQSYLRLMERIDAAAEDPSVKGVYLKLDAVALSFAQIEELRSALAGIRSRGKVVVAYLGRASSNGAYLLATSANRIYVHPAGSLDLIGLGAEMQFYRGTLDLVGVEPQVVRRAEYKSAFESFTNTESSPASREAMDALLDDLYGYLVASIASGRGKSEDEVKGLVDAGPYTAIEAKDKGLIDGIAYEDDLEEDLDSEIPGADYLDEHYRTVATHSAWPAAREIAVIYVDGAIVSGPSRGPGFFGGGTNAGSDTIVAQLEAARDSGRVKGVVLRVDSPGGSAFASDEIWKAVDEVMEEKPVVVSMGGVAASGGYWVSATATAIYANQTTITGSIGVIGAKMSLGDLYAKLGVNTEFYNRGRNASMNSSSKPWDEIELAAIDRMIGETYETFKKKVAEGRNMDVDAVDVVARGRVWSGQDAKERGLVDEIGGFDEALERVRREAGIRDRASVALITYERQIMPDGTAVEREVQALRQALFRDPVLELPPELSLLQTYGLLGDETVWAMMPYQVELR